MNTITVNLENLTDAERQQLMNIVEKSQKPKQWWEGTKFDIAVRTAYCYMDEIGNVYFSRNDEFPSDEKRIAFGNACKDGTYMERRAKEIKLYNMLSNFAEVVNEGWQPDWEDGSEKKYCLLYDCFRDRWNTIHTTIDKCPTEVYFKTEELAQRAIDEIILPLERGEL